MQTKKIDVETTEQIILNRVLYYREQVKILELCLKISNTSDEKNRFFNRLETNKEILFQFEEVYKDIVLNEKLKTKYKDMFETLKNLRQTK